MTPGLLAFLAIVIALALGYAVQIAFYRPRHGDVAELQRAYRDAREKHKPSKEIGRQFVKAVAEQIKQECA